MDKLSAILISLVGLAVILAGARQINGKSYGLRQMFTDIAVTCIALIFGFFAAHLLFG